MLATIGKVTIALTAGDGDDDGSQASKAVEHCQRRQRTGEDIVRRLVTAGGPWEAVVDPRGRLDGEGMEYRR